MTYEQFAKMLTDAYGTDHVAYHAFPVGNVPDLPYIVYEYPNSANFGADNVVYQKGEQFNIWLQTREKDFQAEAMLENLLTENGIYFDKFESFLTSENMYQILYQGEVAIYG